MERLARMRIVAGWRAYENEKTFKHGEKARQGRPPKKSKQTLKTTATAAQAAATDALSELEFEEGDADKVPSFPSCIITTTEEAPKPKRAAAKKNTVPHDQSMKSP